MNAARCWILVIFAVLSVAAERPAFGCSCAMSGPPCQMTWTADAVFSGTVMSITQIEDELLGFRRQSLLVKMNVDRPFLKASPGPIEIVTGMDGGDCGYRFNVGVKYLVYAWKSGGQLTTGICSRTRPLADAQEDLQYLSTINAPPNGGRVYGRINEWRRDPAEDRGVDYGPLQGITVSVRSARFARDVVTSADGRFEISNLPVGKSTISVVPPFGFEPSPFEREIDIADPRACSLVDITLQQLARASGVVVDRSGRAIAGIEIDAVAAELAAFNPDQYQRPVKTDERGAFEFRDLPPGRYVFGINLTKEPYKASQRGVPVFLPGTSVAGEATVFELKAGDNKNLGTLRPPER